MQTKTEKSFVTNHQRCNLPFDRHHQYQVSAPKPINIRYLYNFFRPLTDNVTDYVRVQGVRLSLLPATLLAISYTHLLYLGAYMPFPLHAHSVFPIIFDHNI